MKRINSEEEKLDRDLTQRLMAKYWKPRKSIAHRLKGKLCSETTTLLEIVILGWLWLLFQNYLIIFIALDGTYFYSEPSRYIFPGAEVYKDSNDSKDCNNSSDDDSGNVHDEFMTFPSNMKKKNSF